MSTSLPSDAVPDGAPHDDPPPPVAPLAAPESTVASSVVAGPVPAATTPALAPTVDAARAPAAPRLVRRNHWVVRLTHWVNVVALPLMIGSGLQIFTAFPNFNRKGETFCCYPAHGLPIPKWMRFGGWLAGARHWHFAVMWVLVANALVYLGFLWLHGEWRDIVPRRGDARDAVEMAKFYLFARRDHPHQGKHNALQKLAYFTMPILGAVIVLSGIAIWKPVQLGALTALFGGYAWARYWHFVAMWALIALAVGHIFMVFAVDPYSIRAIVTGWYDTARSPERRNARPFYHLFTRPRAEEAE